MIDAAVHDRLVELARRRFYRERSWTQLVADAELIVTDPAKSLAEGAIVPWRRGTKRMQAYYGGLQNALVRHFDVSEEVPFAELPETFKDALYFGTGGHPIEMSFGGNGRSATKTARRTRAPA